MPAQIQKGTWMGRGQPLLVIMEALYRKCSGTLTGTGAATAHTQIHAENLLQPLVVQQCSLLGRRCQCWEEKEQHLEGMEPTRT